MQHTTPNVLAVWAEKDRGMAAGYARAARECEARNDLPAADMFRARAADHLRRRRFWLRCMDRNVTVRA